MKLLITLDFPPEKGGIQRYLHTIVQRTYSQEDLVIAGCGGSPQEAALDCRAKVEYVRTWLSGIDKKWSLAAVAWRFFFLRLLKGASLSVECGNVYAGCVPWLFSFFMKTDYSVYTHGTEVLGLGKRSVKAAVLGSVLRRARQVFANSGYTASLVGPHVPNLQVQIRPPKIILPQSAAGPQTQQQERERYDSEIRLLSVGRLVKHKGHDVLLTAVSMLPKTMNWRLVIAGDGPCRQALEEHITAAGMAGRAAIVTGLSDAQLEVEYERASLFVLPSVLCGGTEGFGIVLLEAMARRCAVIASDLGGVGEVLDNGSCGLLVPPGDAAALCDAIIRLSGDAVLRRLLVSKAYERLQNKYVWR
jgi:phosphatidylinositol alpha-1,6-mannosyltransferase